MKSLGIDFGDRRIGLALSDEEGRVAVPLVTLERTNDRAAIAEIRRLARAEGVERLVIGEPLGLDGSRGDAARRVASFARKLAAATELPVERINESLTSVEARQRLEAAGVDLRRHPGRIDAVAAQIVLQEALDRHRAGVE